MKLLHTSDWHLGKSLGGHSLVEDQRAALAQVEALLRAEPFDLVVVSGDVFDRAAPSEDAVRLLGAWLGEVRDFAPRLPIVVVAGNHDNGPRLAWTASVLDRQHVYLRGDADRIDDPIVVEGADGTVAEVWALPFLPPGALGEPAPSQAAAVDEALRRIAPRQDRRRAQVLVAHCFVRDCQACDSEHGFIGTAVQIDPAVFAGFDYVALGHLHRPQEAAPNARYAGSIVRYSFSEAGHEKALLAVEVAPGRPPRCVAHPLASLRRMHRIKGPLEALRDDPAYDDRVGDYVELTLDPPVAVGNPLEELRGRWPHLLSFHNDLPGAAAALAAPADAGGPRDLEADFLKFDEQFSTGEATRDELLAAFRELHRQLPEDDA